MIAFNTERLLETIREYPPLPDAVATPLRMLENPDCDAETLISIMTLNAGWSDRLRRALLPDTEVDSPAELMSRIESECGIESARCLLTALILAPLVQNSPDSRLLDASHLWGHSVAAATWSRHLVERFPVNDAYAIYQACLLHDIGIVILHNYEPGIYEAVLDRVREKNEMLDHVETEIIGVTNHRISAMICAQWEIPNELLSAVESPGIQAPCPHASWRWQINWHAIPLLLNSSGSHRIISTRIYWLNSISRSTAWWI